LEAARYSCEISAILPSRDGLPVFDLVLLGLGKDGHTASIFPGHIRLLTADIVCGIAEHPVTGQRRITISGSAINNAEAVIFIASGKNKAQVVRDIVRKNPCSDNYPASHILPVYGSLDWFLDTEAGSLL
jgi:6-phosphogluconolactonase